MLRHPYQFFLQDPLCGPPLLLDVSHYDVNPFVQTPVYTYMPAGTCT